MGVPRSFRSGLSRAELARVLSQTNVSAIMPDVCCIGEGLGKPCSAPPFVRRKQLSDRDIHLLQCRTGVSDISKVCANHERSFLRLFNSNQKQCCDPLELHPDENVKRGLRPIGSDLHDRCRVHVPRVIEGKKLCAKCRKEVVHLLLSEKEAERANIVEAAAGPPLPRRSLRLSLARKRQQETTETEGEETSTSGSNFSPKRAALERVNVATKNLGMTPIDASKLARSKVYGVRKLNEAHNMLKVTLCKISGLNQYKVKEEIGEKKIDFEAAGKEMIEQLRQKFHTCDSYSDKIRILSVLPKSWPKSVILNMFDVSRHLVDKTKQCVEENGIMCSPNPREGKSLPVATLNAVKNFYYQQDISRELPGIKMVKSVKEEGQKLLKPKRLVLGNLKEIFAIFKQQESAVKIGFSKFAELRPPECVLAGAAGTHQVCVCQIHQNVKLMFSGAKLMEVRTEQNTKPFETYKDMISFVLCQDPTPQCFLQTCNLCPHTQHLEHLILRHFEDNFIDKVSYMKWTGVDRSSLEHITDTAKNFAAKLVECLPKLSEHHFIAKQQSEYYRHVKDTLEEGVVLVVADFGENAKFILQDSVQGAHWKNDQVTIHPFACYHRPAGQGEPQPLSFVVLSDCLDHKTYAVHAFQGELCKFLRSVVPGVRKIIYFSDGCKAQYKNRYNMADLMNHLRDFGLEAEWNFFATSHGKGPSDGLTGITKTTIARANLQLPPEKQVQTPRQFYELAVEKLPKIKFVFVSQSTTDLNLKFLKKRFSKAEAIPEITKQHRMVPQEGEVLSLQRFSQSPDHRLCHLEKVLDDGAAFEEKRYETRNTAAQNGANTVQQDNRPTHVKRVTRATSRAH